MAKRRFNSKKIANTPSLKKRMARFCAEVETQFNKPDYKEMLYAGHRGFISYAEDALCKEFDKRLGLLRDKYSALKVKDDKAKQERFYRIDREFEDIQMWYEEGVEIANEIFEEQFL